ncbi:MAG: hypothetical protein OEV42_04045 [Deltaproteobacteria bacterium]|nr:hypothetical protein [Deltaproteobacteria bacterium]
MKTIMQLVFSVIFLCFLSSNLWALASTQTINEKGQIVETFYTNADPYLIALTAGPAGLLKPFPPSLPYLSEPNIADGLAALAKVTDSSGEVVGFASELEHFTVDATGNLTAAVEWTFKVPGRGTLLVTQTESPAMLIEIIEDMAAKGETERYFDPPLKVQTTVPGTGRVVVGLGEFEGLTGTFKEYNEFIYLNFANDTIEANLIFEVTYDKNEDDNQQ